MKCDVCGKLLLFNGITVNGIEHICKSHLTEWGFTPDDLKDERYKHKSWKFLSKGKTECDEIYRQQEYIKAHTHEVKINLGDIEDEKLERFIIREAKKDLSPDDLYEGWTVALMREYDDEGPHYIFQDIDFDCEVKEGQVIFGSKVIATTGAEELKKYDCRTYLNIMGGKYRRLSFDGEKMFNNSGELGYWLQLKLIYMD